MSAHEHDAVDVSNATDMETEEKKQKKEHGHGHSHDHDEGKHAEICSIGTVTIAGSTFMIDREGQVECGKETEFGVELVGGKEATPSAAWLANPNGDKVADPVEGEGHDKHWHFKVDPLMPVKKSKFVLKVGDEEGIVDFCHGARPTNGGILAVFKGLGFLELKLHGDAGDLELWLYSGASLTQNVQERRVQADAVRRAEGDGGDDHLPVARGQAGARRPRHGQEPRRGGQGEHARRRHQLLHLPWRDRPDPECPRTRSGAAPPSSPSTAGGQGRVRALRPLRARGPRLSS